MKRVFLIDDDTDDAEIFEMALNSLALPTQLTRAKNGLDAISQAQSPDFPRPDYIFLDLNMPMVNGVECLAEMRSKKLLEQVPVYIYTTSATGPDIERCRQMGGILFTKHSSFQALLNGLREILS